MHHPGLELGQEALSVGCHGHTFSTPAPKFGPGLYLLWSPRTRAPDSEINTGYNGATNDRASTEEKVISLYCE